MRLTEQMINLVLILLIVILIVLAGLFAGAETGVYQLSRLRLRLGIERKQLSFIILGRALRDSGAVLVSMLLGTNLAHYLATSIVTYMLLSRLESAHSAELFAAVVTAPVLFVFSELIPKNIFFYRADTLMPWVAWLVFTFERLFTWCGLVPLLKFISLAFARLSGAPAVLRTTAPASSSYIKAILQETHEEGFLSPIQTDIINRLAGIRHTSIMSVMIPISEVQTIGADSDRPALLSKLKESVFSRLLVYDCRPTNITGFINIYDCLSSSGQFADLRNFINPIRRLSGDTVVTDAINIMQSEKQKIVLVTKTTRIGGEKPVGIVTMKDLVEELVGELREW